MVYLSDILDIDLLKQDIDQGYVTQRLHESFPLCILNYSKATQFEWRWDGVTDKCRGLIYNYETMEVVARPFEKFMNWDQDKVYPPTGPVLRMPKMDGSLGVLYPILTQKSLNGYGYTSVSYGIATRGSFHSDQAEWATKFFNSTLIEQEFGAADEGRWKPGLAFQPRIGNTYLFEIIYPENRIVVDYGDYRGLILLDVIDNETGFADTDEFDNCEWPDKVKRIPLPGFDSGQTADVPPGDEGFVYLWPARNYRVKLKSAEYVYLHRLISNLNEKTIWEMLVANKTLDDIKRDLPEEFHGYVDDKGQAMLDSARMDMGEAYALHREVVNLPSRRAQAEAIKDSPYRAFVFKLLDGKDIWLDCLKANKPKKSDPLVKED